MTGNDDLNALPQLRVFADRSVLFLEDGRVETYAEGPPDAAAVERADRIQAAFEAGFLSDRIEANRESATVPDLDDRWAELLNELVDGVTADKGRALVVLSVLQLCVKSIEPDQNIRLHKGGQARRSDFSWQSGLSMRKLDERFITPVLRSENLLSMNKFGGMMTRTLAENYPYSLVYKASLRGPRTEWLELTEGLEAGSIDPDAALDFFIQRLIARSEGFASLVAEAHEGITAYAQTVSGLDEVAGLLLRHMHTSVNSARLLEVSMHSLMQALEDAGLLRGRLRPLGQMRSANKKAGNIGDVEITDPATDIFIIEAWDAKYKQTYLYDQLLELNDKIAARNDIECAGFVVDEEPEMRSDVVELIDDIEEQTGVEITLQSLETWVADRCSEVDAGGLEDLAAEWLIAYVESLCLLRVDRAPLDEPTERWIRDLVDLV